ncbi:MAG TPA: gamma-aminobutyraldehyde dehydrogenase [Alicyclobacillus sp.]|nr:gamma-aminobutyraldehyde dehydrogenase [Alicyclobacillus sp.]
MESFRMWIGGQWINSATGEEKVIIDPATGEEVGKVPEAAEEDVHRAVAAAQASFESGVWAGATPGERAGVLLRVADLLEQQAQAFARLETRQTGKPLKLSVYSDIPACIDNIRFFAGLARHVEGKAAGEYLPGYTSVIRRDPVGVVASIAPWNYPLLMAIWKLMPALAAGNSVVIKPAPNTPLTTLKLAAILQEAGIPDGVMNVVTGEGSTVGAWLTGHPAVNMISFTGSTQTGAKIMQAASDTTKRLHLELGGKAPFIVFDDADLKAAVQGAVVGAFVNSGQDCTAATRLYVQKTVYDAFVAKFVEAAGRVRVGLPQEWTTDMGPVISQSHRERVEGYVERARQAGAEVLTGGRRPDDPKLAAGSYYEPTILAGLTDDAEACQQEIFGPVVVVMPFSDEEEVIRRANGVVYGLASSVWTRNHQRALRLSKALRFGTVWINDHLPLTSEMPHGGFKQSGFGKDLSAYSLEDYMVVKHVMSELEGKAVKPWHFTVFGDVPQE